MVGTQCKKNGEKTYLFFISGSGLFSHPSLPILNSLWCTGKIEHLLTVGHLCIALVIASKKIQVEVNFFCFEKDVDSTILMG